MRMDKLFEKLKATNFNWVNKYSIVIILFAVWVCFFDKYNLLTQRHLSGIVNDLEERKTLYEDQLQEALKERDVINSDIEKFAREQYFMHKDDEHVFKIEDPKEK